MTRVRTLLEPESIAVVGASPSPDKSGSILLKNLIDHGFPGRLYPIHPTAASILGRPAFPSVAALPEPVDLAFLVVPAAGVAEVLRQCEARGVRAVVIVSAGFGEVGDAGATAEAELRRILARSGIRAIGPNTIGFVNVPRRLVASFVPFASWRDGPVALAAQSGLFVGALADELMARTVQRIGIRLAVAFGNKIDLDEVDFLEHACRDPAIRVIAFHLESFRRPRRFLELAGRVARDTPVVVFKTGRTRAGARAAASHTGALALDDRILDSALRQANVTRARSLEEFLALIRAFAWLPPPRGPRVGILTFSGANGVIAADEVEEAGLGLASLAPATLERIKALLPDWQPVGNPVDLWLAVGAGARRAHEEPLSALLDDPEVDAVLAILLALPNTDFAGVRETFAEARRRHPDKPLFLVVLGGGVKARWLGELEGLEIPVDSDSRLSVRTLQAMREYGRRRERRALSGWGA